jgi:lysozyme
MKTSDHGIIALMLHEGIVPAPYRDSAGVWTWGVGHTAAAGEPIPANMPRGMPADLDRALVRVMEVFRKDLAKYEAEVARVLPSVKQHEFDAAVSFHYNTGAIARASWVKRLRAGDVAGAARGIMAWVKPPELRKRREAERDLLLLGQYPAGSIPVYGATQNGTVIWKPVRTLSPADALALMRPKGREVYPQKIEVAAPPAFEPLVGPKHGGIWAAIAAFIVGLFRRKA